MIPQQLKLAGITITVEISPTLYAEEKILGKASYPDQKIILDSSMLGQDLMNQNFFHELVHWILYVMNEDALRDNEKFVDVFSFFLHQALVTKEGDGRQ